MRWTFLLALALTSCGSNSSPAPSQPVQDASVEVAAEGGPEASPDAEATDGEVPEAGPEALPPVVELTVFATTDEHGWLQPFVDGGFVYGGAANVRGWMAQDGLDVSKHLLLSSGDNWAGPAVSSYFQGEPTVQAFNLMGYQASALGNHEFDWGQDVLKKRLGEAHYKPLAANIRVKSTGSAPDYVQRYMIVPVQGVSVGLIGVTTTATVTATSPKNVADLEFADIEQTLESVIPEVRGAGAEVVVVLAHKETGPMIGIAESMNAHADLILAGHGHDLGQQMTSKGTMVACSGSNFMSYTVTKLTYDRALARVTSATTEEKKVFHASSGPNPVTPDPALESLANEWQSKLDLLLGEEIGYTASGISNTSWAMGNWVCDAWLAMVPDADIAITNFGGLRQPVPSGVITKQTIFDVMPFENRLIQVQVTGAQLLENVKIGASNAPFAGGYPAVGGMTFSGYGPLVSIKLPGGVPLDLNKTYKVLINSYMYEGGNSYLFGEQDPNGMDLGVNYRDLVMQWTQQQASSVADPIENHIDAAPRNL